MLSLTSAERATTTPTAACSSSASSRASTMVAADASSLGLAGHDGDGAAAGHARLAGAGQHDPALDDLQLLGLDVHGATLPDRHLARPHRPCPALLDRDLAGQHVTGVAPHLTAGDFCALVFFHHRLRISDRSMPGLCALPAVRIEDDRLRVTEWRFAPGAVTGHHRHEYAYVVVPLTTRTLAISGSAGVASAAIVVGEPYFRPAASSTTRSTPTPSGPSSSRSNSRPAR